MTEEHSAPIRHIAKFRSSPEAEARILLLVDAFSRKHDGSPRCLEGRVKLAKLDFLLRYPRYLHLVLRMREASQAAISRAAEYGDEAPLDNRMVRYRYGPWDPSYFAVLGALIGRQLAEAIPTGSAGFGYRTTERGALVAGQLLSDAAFWGIADRLHLLRTNLDMSGGSLKSLVYRIPDISDASWHQELR